MTCLLLTPFSPQIFTATKTFKVKVKYQDKNKQKTKTATCTCDFKIKYSGDSASKAGSSVDCSYPNEIKKTDTVTSTTKTMSFILGDVAANLFTVEVKFSFSKNKKKDSKTVINTVVSAPFAGMLSALLAKHCKIITNPR